MQHRDERKQWKNNKTTIRNNTFGNFPPNDLYVCDEKTDRRKYFIPGCANAKRTPFAAAQHGDAFRPALTFCRIAQ